MKSLFVEADCRSGTGPPPTVYRYRPAVRYLTCSLVREMCYGRTVFYSAGTAACSVQELSKDEGPPAAASVLNCENWFPSWWLGYAICRPLSE